MHFPKLIDEDMLSTSPCSSHQFQTLYNSSYRSSSSAESASPDSFHDVSARSPISPIHRKRPIFGRGALYQNEPSPRTPTTPPMKMYFEDLSPIKSIWQEESPKEHPINNPRTPFYELFPKTEGSQSILGFNSTVRKPVPMPQPRSRFPGNLPSSQPQNLPTNYQTPFKLPAFASTPSPYDSYMGTKKSPPFMHASQNFLRQSSVEMAGNKMCTFCRKNGETSGVYMTHGVKEKIGNKNIVTCPILRAHVCPKCNATGDNAHTITYCPILRCNNNGMPLQSTTITLKNTRIKSNGKKRF